MALIWRTDDESGSLLAGDIIQTKYSRKKPPLRIISAADNVNEGNGEILAMRSTIVLLLLVATLVDDRGRETNAKDRHQLQLHAALAYLGFRNDRIVEYKPHEVSLDYTGAVKYCRDAGSAIAQPKDNDDLFYGLQGMQ